MSSIVTLLGKIECQTKVETDVAAADDDDTAATADNKTNRQDRTIKIWTWKGSWAFGSQDPPWTLSHETATHGGSSNSVIPSALPFSYTFQRVVDASLTPIPSLQPSRQSQGVDPAAPHSSRDHDNTIPNLDTTTTTTSSTLSTTTIQNNQSETKNQTDSMVQMETKEAPIEQEKSKNHSHESTTTVKTGDNDSNQNSKTTASKITTIDDNPPSGGKTERTSTAKDQNDTTRQYLADPSAKPTGPTFGDDGFVDACTKYPDKLCPPSGRWKGSFEAATGRKGHLRQEIPEYFDLFLYAEPPADAQVQFTSHDDGKNNPSSRHNSRSPDQGGRITPPAPVPPQHVYIRGAGENQFGLFELVGSFSLVTHVLRLQRLYVSIPTASSPPRRGRGRKARTSGSEWAALGRSTRKRQLSWKRKAAQEEESWQATSASIATGAVSATSSLAGGATAGGGKGAGGGRGGDGASGDDTQSRPTKKQKRKRTGDESVSVATVTTTGTIASGTNHGVTSGFGTIPTTVDTTTTTTTTTKFSAKAHSTASRKMPAASRSSPSGRSGSPELRLPLEGDYPLARWRAAHFYHYHPAQKDGGNAAGAAASSAHAAATKSVVYEGELYGGQREGRGVCAYNNDMIYEGEWHRDKEHGVGSLWTGDRKRLIYQGEWEKGRMHGNGKYYYYGDSKSGESAARKRKIQSRYEGEFRENLRHGTGMYVLPDGSTYNGQWQNGAMSGRGTFTWPDGSVYDGEWKDNQRHGNGILKASDGFMYEGAWVQNTMEGRGSATYPDGQEYHGMFSGGRREGRGTIKFPNGAIYEGRFRDDAVDGQGTMKIRKAVLIPRNENNEDEIDEESLTTSQGDANTKKEISTEDEAEIEKADFMIPISFQSDIGHIHRKAGFTIGGD